MPCELLVLTALETELTADKLPSDRPIVYTGIGKINATLASVEAIARYQPKKILNFGTAGGVNVQAKGLIQVGKVIQRDMLAEPLAPRGTVPFCTRPQVYLSGQGGLTCATGDSFVTAHDPWLVEQNVDVVDMELFAIAAVAHHHGIPWIGLKYISDHANESSADDWQTSVNAGEAAFLSYLARVKL
jgi:adenosylhomocysteine nucleosidase